MKIENIKPRCLVVVETLDEFAAKASEIDSTTEDFCAYITSLGVVGYANSIEGLWGKLGFVWDLKNDYGHFENLGQNFSIIPSVPDGHRIHQIPENFFDGIVSETLTLQKSNWENLTKVFIPNNKTINLDLTGAPITHVYTPNLLTVNKDIYIKADFSNVVYFDFSGLANKTLIMDNDNKYFNLPFSIQDNTTTENTATFLKLVYNGSGAFNSDYLLKETLNYVGVDRNIPVFKVSASSHNYDFKLTALLVNTYSSEASAVIQLYDDYFFKKTVLSEENIKNAKNRKLVINIDLNNTTTPNLAVKLKNILPTLKITGVDELYKVEDYITEESFKLFDLDINFIGDFSLINVVDIYFINKIYTKSDGLFEEALNSPYYTSVSKQNGYLFYKCIFDYIPNITLDYVNNSYRPKLFHNSLFCVDEIKDEIITISDNYRFSDTNNNYIKKYVKQTYYNLIPSPIRITIYEIPSYTISDSYFENKEEIVCSSRIPENTTLITQYIKINSMALFIPESSKIDFCRIEPQTPFQGATYLLGSGIGVPIIICENYNKKCVSCYSNGRFNLYFVLDFSTSIVASTIDCFEDVPFDNRTYLKNGTIHTCFSNNNKAVLNHQLIISNFPLGTRGDEIFYNVIDYKVNNLKFIYNSNCDFSKYIQGKTFINQLLEALEPGPAYNNRYLKFSSSDYALLTEENKDYIINTCRYTINV